MERVKLTRRGRVVVGVLIAALWLALVLVPPGWWL